VTAVEVGLGFQGDKSPEEYEQLPQLAERGGADVVVVYQDLFFQPAIYPLLLMARVTERVRLGPAGLNPFTLHPVEIAGQAAALDAASGAAPSSGSCAGLGSRSSASTRRGR
jgi:5,10-methylenetetrahydromethanopterin reductase